VQHVYGLLTMLSSRNKLPTRLRELIIMRLAWRAGSDYAWFQHYRIATQAGVRPPHFVLFTSGFLQAGYRRFIERRLREEFGFHGTPVHLSMRLREKRAGASGRGSRAARRA